MNLRTNEPEWNTLKKRIKMKFSKLSDSDVNSLRGHISQITAKVQKAYNYDKERAEVECSPFLKKTP